MLYQNENDETLVMLTLAGEQRAYEVLVTRYQSAVIASAAQITRNHFMAEDASQDAFVSAWMKLNTLKSPEKFGAWVCKIAKNCALNTVMRYRSFIPLEKVENYELLDDPSTNPAQLYAHSEEKKELHGTIDRLPEKIREIIELHYFEGLSVAEIASRRQVSVGTVKWQLHDGRKRIRKELCAMNEKYSDTLVQRVMKKVEELKLWQAKNDKSGFEVIYKEVLDEIDQLPECSDKYHALADVLMRGWWWLPGEKNDALFERIKEAAINGKNDEVMEFIVTREDSKLWGGAKIDFILNKQIPMLQKAGFTRSLGREWFRLGDCYFDNSRDEEGRRAYDKAREVLTEGDLYYALVPAAHAMREDSLKNYKSKHKRKYSIGASAQKLKYVNGNLTYWKADGAGEGYLYHCTDILRFASYCDGRFFEESLKVGEQYVGSDGSTLTFSSDCETVNTPCGTFEGCQLWTTRYENYTMKAYYKSGVGIVKLDHVLMGFSDVMLLTAYSIAGGSGLLPLAKGNSWEYEGEYPEDVMLSKLTVKVSFADKEKVIVASNELTERIRYNPDSWRDNIEEIRNEYWGEDENEREFIRDVSAPIERAKSLAKTPMEKAHTKAACSVAQRIMATDTTFNPEHTATGHWNFFERNVVENKNGTVKISGNYRWSFEWKNTGSLGEADTPLLYNDVLGILQDATGCVWSDEWKVGASPLVEYTLWNQYNIRTQIVCKDGGSITTKAGTFENCLMLSLDISGLENGLAYRAGKKEYYFAEGIGIVRTVNEYCGGARRAVYELTSYEGTGEGYMPFSDGMTRRYDALDLTDGFVGAADYTYVADEEGNITVFEDRTGIRELPPPITHYGAVCGEIEEEKLWEAKKYDESRLCHDVNNFNLLCHFLGRDSRYWGAHEKAAAWNKYKIKVMEGLGENGEVPKAWLGHYASTTFRTACALFGCGRKDEGYVWLEKAFEVYPQWDAIENNTEMEVGDPLIYGDIKVVKGKGIVKLPDGTTEPLPYDWLFEGNSNLMHYGMTALNGWEWFNSVRDEERFKEYVERARALKESKKKEQ